MRQQKDYLEGIAKFMFEDTCAKAGARVAGYGTPWEELEQEVKTKYYNRVEPVLEAMISLRLVIILESETSQAYQPPKQHPGQRPVLRLFEREGPIRLTKKGG